MTKGTTDACCEATLELALAQKGYVLPRLIIPMTGRDPPDLNNLARLMQRGPLSEADHGES
jgi:hypothetical protein